jgi:hypothetical protein
VRAEHAAAHVGRELAAVAPAPAARAGEERVEGDADEPARRVAEQRLGVGVGETTAPSGATTRIASGAASRIAPAKFMA